ncbi:MAG: iduronate sulfatase [Verrucomicrobia bacterium]|nr:iduronate sulfatase [Verrucomicrobiota bacterium]
MFLRSLFFLLLASSAIAAPKPNVLFLMADDFRPELASYGSPALTPNLDRLSKRGIQFSRAYCQQAVCNPSRSSMLTGKRPDTLKIWCNSVGFRELNPDVKTLPEWFKDNGYVTRCVGKIFHNWHTKDKGDRRSWSADEFLHYANHGDDVASVEGVLPPNLSTGAVRKYGQVEICECRDVPDEAYYDGRVAAEAVRVMGEIKDEPFFLAVGFWKPHAPFNAPKKYWDLYAAGSLPELNPNRPEGAPDLAFHESTELLGIGKDKVRLTPEQALEWRRGYFANISYLDAQLGKVLDALDKNGLSENTIITFVGDNGYHIGEHELWGKTSNFEYDAHVPLLISVPGSKNAGMTSASLSELVDLFPTLVELCRLPKPEGLEGTSLVPLLENPSAAFKPASFTQHPRPAYYDRVGDRLPQTMGYSVRTASVRYTEWVDWKTKAVVARELYHHAQDPGELKNCADDPAYREPQREAATLLHAQLGR